MSRCFLGFELSEDSRRMLRDRLVPLHAELAETRNWPVRLVPPANWHATLLFFPDLETVERTVVWAEVERGVREGVWTNLNFAWRGLALWPSPKRPNLVCLEADPYSEAKRWPVYGLLDQEPFCKGRVDGLRRYVPHITVMRFRRDRYKPQPGAWQALQNGLTGIPLETVRFDRISLFLSTTTSQAPIYPREHTAALG